MRAIALVFALALALGGCVTPAGMQPASTDLPDLSAVTSLLAGIPCEAKSVGAGTSENLRVIANVSFENGGRAEIDPWNGWLVTGSKNGLDFIDARDPLAPVVAYTYPYEKGYGDAKWIANGTLVAVARQVDVEVLAVDWSDPAVPNATSLGAWKYPLPGPGHMFTNMHMLEAHDIAGEPYFLLAPNDDTGVWMVHVKRDGPTSATFEALPPIGGPLTGGPLGPHDMTVEHDLILKKPILYIANGFEGWQAFDISDPKKPTRLALLPNLGVGQSYTHTIAGNQVGSRRIVVTIAEVGPNTMKVFDATDFSRPILLAEWWADKADPHQPQHDINILDGKLYMAHYSYGVYVFDLKKLGTAPLLDTPTLSPVAHLAPAKRMDGGALGFANVFDVVVMNGVMYVSDFTDPAHGVTAVGYGCLEAGNAMHTSG